MLTLTLTRYSSVRRCSCGLSVNILSYLSQPSSFWRETLKELMHSMSMAMVRDKAVENFVERLHSLELLQGTILLFLELA